MIQAVRAQALKLPLAIPFRTSQHTRAAATASVVVAELRAGEHVGLGEAHAADAEAAKLAVEEALSRGTTVEEAGARIRQLENAAARCALDIAWHDLQAQREGLPLWEHLGLPAPGDVESAITVPIDDLESCVARARALASEGHPILKAKTGVHDDVELVTRLRDAVGAEPRIWVDANQAWDWEAARRFVARTREANVEMIEQPFRVGQLDLCRRLRGETDAAIFLDEDVRSATEVESIARAQAADGVNVKLSRVGGVSPALEMLRRAKELGLQRMAGCFIQTSLGLAAAAHLGAFLNKADLDGATFLAEDPFVGMEWRAGRIRLPDAPGIGVRRG